MNAEPTVWLLLDGALLGAATVSNELRGLAGAYPLYGDLGREPALVGPWLVPASADAQALCDLWHAEREEACFGLNELRVDAGREHLVAHLDQLRYVHALRQPGKRFFFRYADHRGLAAMWDTLRPTQQQALLGSIRRWAWRTPDGTEAGLASPRLPASPVEPGTLPLRLYAASFQRMEDEAHLGALLQFAVENFPDQTSGTTLARRYAAAQRVSPWADERGIRQSSVQAAAVVAVARLGEGVLRDTDFIEVVDAAQAASRPEPILDWLNAQATSEFHA